MKLEESDYAVQIDEQTNESWTRVLAEFADANVYQTWAYGAIRWGARNLSHVVIRKGGIIVGAAQLRVARVPFCKAGVAYLRWGPLFERKDKSLAVGQAGDILREVAKEYCRVRRLSVVVVPNGCAEEARGAELLDGFERCGLASESTQPAYRTIMVDLTRPPEVIRKQLDQKWRNQLNRAEKNGLLVESNDNDGAYQHFDDLYRGMLARKQFESSVNVEEFRRMQDLLGNGERSLIFTAKEKGKVVGAIVCSCLGSTGIYLLGATSELGRDLKASYLLHWQAILWLRERGATSYDLGGIDEEKNPGGFHFKKGFNGSVASHLPVHRRDGNWLSGLVATYVTRRRKQNRSATAPAEAPVGVISQPQAL